MLDSLRHVFSDLYERVTAFMFRKEYTAVDKISFCYGRVMNSCQSVLPEYVVLKDSQNKNCRFFHVQPEEKMLQKEITYVFGRVWKEQFVSRSQNELNSSKEKRFYLQEVPEECLKGEAILTINTGEEQLDRFSHMNIEIDDDFKPKVAVVDNQTQFDDLRFSYKEEFKELEQQNKTLFCFDKVNSTRTIFPKFLVLKDVQNRFKVFQTRSEMIQVKKITYVFDRIVKEEFIEENRMYLMEDPNVSSEPPGYTYTIEVENVDNELSAIKVQTNDEYEPETLILCDKKEDS